MQTRINGHLLGQLDQNLPVRLYKDGGTDSDGLRLILCACRTSEFSHVAWLDNAGSYGSPVVMTVHEARHVIRRGFADASKYFVESAE